MSSDGTIMMLKFEVNFDRDKICIRKGKQKAWIEEIVKRRNFLFLSIYTAF